MGNKEKRKKQRQPLGLGRWIVLIVCAIVFCGCLGYLGIYAKDKLRAQNDFKELGKEAQQDDRRDLKSLWQQNNDFIGWIAIEGTKIDYPVMQTINEPEFYLHKNFEKEHSSSGTPFLDAGNVIYGSQKTWNWFIYGHNMKIGTMFHDVLKYEDKSFFEEHPTFTFDVYNSEDNNIEEGEYEVFAAARSKIYEKKSTAFKYYQYQYYTEEETFDEFISGVKAEALYDTGIVPVYGEQLVTLSTCAYHTEDGRFYIVGRKIN